MLARRSGVSAVAVEAFMNDVGKGSREGGRSLARLNLGEHSRHILSGSMMRGLVFPVLATAR
jgi:hypothetical protein